MIPVGLTRCRGSSGRWSALLQLMVLAVLLAAPAAAHEEQEESPPDLRTTGSLRSDFLLGLEAAQAIALHFGLVEADSVLERVNRIGYSVARAAGHPEILFTFQVLDVDEPNAMALPGGWIFLTRGILETALTDAELAHLLGHEITHITRSHFSRQGRLNSLLSVLQTAAIVMVAIAGSRASPSGPVIQEPGSYQYPQSSADAALAGTAVFGSVFHELLLRGYSRKLEVEADDGGRRLAALAGYPREAGAGLLQKLHDQIYEDREFGYWRTHPYFTDRVAAARAAASGADYPAPESAVIAYRAAVQRGLASAASVFVEDEIAGYLYELALRAGPGGGSNLAVRSQLLGFRLQRLHRRSPILRPYGPLLTAYDSLLAQGRRAGGDPAVLHRIAASRDTVEAQRLALLPQYLAAVGKPNTSTQILELFLTNFPDHELSDPVRLSVARSYRLSGRFDLAAERLGDLLTEEIAPAAAPDSSPAQRARTELLRALPQVEDPDVCQRLYERIADPDIRRRLLDRLQTIADSLTSLERVGRFAQTYPFSPAADRFRERLVTLAGEEFKKGRLHEAMGDKQGALGIYNKVAILAPGTRYAAEARQGITRIQALSTSRPGR